MLTMDLLLQQLKEIWWLPPVLCFNVLGFLYSSNWVRWIYLTSSVVVSLVLFILGCAMFDSYSSGCYGAPKDVEFRQGMTICPGQTAHGSINPANTRL